MPASAHQTDPPEQPPRHDRQARLAWLPSRTALLVAGIAFVLGLLLFGALWLDQRSDNDFYQADGIPRSVEGQAFDPLPAPLPASETGHVGRDGNDDEGDFAETPEDAPEPVQPAAPPPPTVPVAPMPVPAPPPLPDASMPRPLAAPAPSYPRDAQRRGQQGTVVLRVHVDARGAPGEIDIVSGSGSRSLDRAAIEAVRRWTFSPAVRNGQAVPGTVQVPIDFTLQR